MNKNTINENGSHNTNDVKPNEDEENDDIENRLEDAGLVKPPDGKFTYSNKII